MSIVLKNVCKAFSGQTVLNNFSYEFKKGSVTCIMGESGVGKTTLARILLGLETKDSGEITGVPERKAAVFQEDRLCEDFLAAANVKFCCDKSLEEIYSCFSELCLDQDEIKNKRVRELSGGMKRRVAIARALLYDADLYIFDEAFKGLDSETRKKVAEYILSSLKGKTLIFISHSTYEAELLGAEILVMKK